MPKHGQGINVVDDDLFVSSVDELATPLLIVKENLLRASLFLGCGEGFQFCMSLPDGCLLLKMGVQCLIINKDILCEKFHLIRSFCEDVSIITIFNNPPRVSTKRPVRITSVPKFTPLIITLPGPIPYSSNKVVH